jgi:hypothetical protein
MDLEYQEPLSAEARFLLLGVRATHTDSEARELVDAYASFGPERCRKSAETNRVSALVGATLARLLPDAGLSSDWWRAVERNRARVETLSAYLARIFSAFQEKGVEAAVIEGGGMLLATSYPMAGYGAGDFDVLVSEAGFHDALSVVRAAGFEPVDRRGRPTTRVEHVRREATGELFIEVGHRPFDRMWLPLSFEDRSRVWLHRRVPSSKVSGTWVLAPTDALVSCAAHASLHSYVRSPGLRLHIDTDRVVRAGEIDWDAFVDEVIDSGLRTRAFVSLAVAAGLLSTPVPSDVLKRLAPTPSRWRRIHALIRSERVIADGRPKLGRRRAALLDVLLDDRGPGRWFKSLLVPDREWMREHFDRSGEGASLLRLHVRRALAFAGRYRPE